ncbi:hypothetical protein GE061_002073 [Apolygus lucorum]|uniref:carbonyl reductase (NADPH) n=1 Tax=Apolygus lucorum TaxID=248454 RepID=A0A8S9X5H9_APOLU|nr:hypothetical protein GE061_002073 [Apolygus lucorum]
MVLSIKYASSSVWQEVCKKVEGAAVFVDEPAGECLSWHGGINLILESGAVSIKEFSSFESGENALKAVFIVSTPLTGPTRMILRDLISNSKFQHCILITSCSPSVLTLASTGKVSENNEEMTALHKLETDMLHWMKNKEYAVEILHLFVSCVPISDSLFTFPQFSHIMPCFTEDLIGRTPYSSVPRNLDLEALPLELQVGVVHIMTTLSSLLSKLSARESIYCLGMVSSLVGSQLQKHSTSAVRLRNAEHDMSLLLIDRNLDLCGPLMVSPAVHGSLMDQIKSVLPPLPSHSVDVAIDMSSLCFGSGVEVNGYTPVSPGCFHDPESEWVDTLIHRPMSEIVPYLFKRLSEALNLKDIPAKVTQQHLQDLVTAHFDKNYEMMEKHLSILQASVGVLSALSSKKNNDLEVVESLQKMILQSVAAEDGTNEAFQHLIGAVLERRDRGLNVDSIFSLLVFLYSLVGRQFNIDQNLEKGLKDVVLEMMTEEVAKDKPSVIVDQVKEQGNVDDFVEKVFVRLGALRNSRRQMERYVNVALYHGPASPLEYEGVLSQLLFDVVDVTRPDMPDLKYKANISHRNNLASRFTMMLNSKPQLVQNDVILLFIIGGITGHEIKQINNIFRIYGKRVTGSNKGIGFGIVKNLCSQFKGTVYLTSRDVERGKQSVEKLKQEGLRPAFHQLDILDPKSIEEFASFLEKTHGGIDILVNNAAIAFKNDAVEPFDVQAETTLKTNYFALKKVCEALYPLLRPHARVVTLSSSAGHLHRIPGTELRKRFGAATLTEEELDDLMQEFLRAAKVGNHSDLGWPNSAYVVSKVGVSALTRLHHQTFLKDSREDIVINHVHPGYVDTDMTSHKGPLTIAQGADAPTYAALLPENCKSPRGEYIWFTRAVVDWINGPVPV